MSYTKNTWIDQDVERPKTYEVTNNQDGSITLTDSFGLVTELGTPVNAVNMNHIEDGIDGCAIRKHNLTETFALGEWVLGGTGDDEGIYKSLIANNVGNAVTDDTKWEKVKMGGASGRNVGEIIQSSLPLTDAGLHLLDGSLLQYGIYKEFIDYIANLYAENPNANYFTTESAWQQSITTYGVCGKFVYNPTNNTVRLPKITGIIEGTTDVTALGDLIEQFVRLPNITGNFGSDFRGLSGYANGAFVLNNDNSPDYGVGAGTTYRSRTVNFTASRSSSVYSGNGSNTKIQPQSTKVFYYIVIATSTKTDIQVDIDEIATDLNGKADTDLTNVTDTGYIKMAGAGMPSGKYIDLTLGARNSTYTAPANGWFFFLGRWTNADAYIQLRSVNNYYCVQTPNITANGYYGLMMPILEGDTCRIDYVVLPSNVALRFIYAQGSESEAQ